jgi:hypothetical protein
MGALLRTQWPNLMGKSSLSGTALCCESTAKLPALEILDLPQSSLAPSENSSASLVPMMPSEEFRGRYATLAGNRGVRAIVRHVRDSSYGTDVHLVLVSRDIPVVGSTDGRIGGVTK